MQHLLLAVVASSWAFSALASDRVEGEITLSIPQCDLFVVRTNHGFSLLREHSYHSVFEGDRVRGQLHLRGPQEIEIVGEITLWATVEDWGLSLEQAKTIFYPRCR